MSTTEAVLDQVRNCLMDEAEQALARAERYAASKRQGERNSVPIYAERGQVALQAVALIIQPPEWATGVT